MKGKMKGGSPSKGVKPTDPAPSDVYAGANSNVVKSAKSKSGAFKGGGAIGGKKAAMRLDRPGRKAGGRVGADSAPLSTAARVSPPVGGSQNG